MARPIDHYVSISNFNCKVIGMGDGSWASTSELPDVASLNRGDSVTIKKVCS